jgi:hypothetical protein
VKVEGMETDSSTMLHNSIASVQKILVTSVLMCLHRHYIVNVFAQVVVTVVCCSLHL